jgi:hypothetical protein
MKPARSSTWMVAKMLVPEPNVGITTGSKCENQASLRTHQHHMTCSPDLRCGPRGILSTVLPKKSNQIK